MTVHCIQSSPPKALQAALNHFEEQFDYPLGSDDRFHIDHGSDYSTFFQAMGRPAIFVYEDNQRVHGVLSCARRTISGPEGDVEALYLCDLKVEDGPKKGRILLRLLRAVHKEFREQIRHGYAVVMDGTAVVPSQYTGRLGLPAFQAIGTVGIYNLILPREKIPEAKLTATTLSAVRECFSKLSQAGYRSLDSQPTIRSAMPPTGLMLADRSACGLVEDTERGKQLVSHKHGSLNSAHLSQFAFQSSAAGAAIVRGAANICLENGRPRLFFALDQNSGEALLSQLPEFEVVRASATIYSHGFDQSIPWQVNSSEI